MGQNDRFSDLEALIFFSARGKKRSLGQRGWTLSQQSETGRRRKEAKDLTVAISKVLTWNGDHVESDVQCCRLFTTNKLLTKLIEICC